MSRCAGQFFFGLSGISLLVLVSMVALATGCSSGETRGGEGEGEPGEGEGEGITSPEGSAEGEGEGEGEGSPVGEGEGEGSTEGEGEGSTEGEGEGAEPLGPQPGDRCAVRGDLDCGDGVELWCHSRVEGDPEAYCTRWCTDDRDCPDSMRCVNPDSDLDRPPICVWRPYCSPCERDEQCPGEGSRCVADQQDQKFCSQLCEQEGRSCPLGSSCQDIGGGLLQCMPDRGTCLLDGELCEPCLFHTDCRSGICLVNQFSKEHFCSQTCSNRNPCPDYFECSQSLCLPPAFSCIAPSAGGFCEACRADLDCPAGYCIGDPMTGETYCVPDCTADADVCPLGSQCMPVFMSESRQFVARTCVPDRDSCVSALECKDVQCEANQYCRGGRCRDNRAICSSCQPGDAMVCGNGNYCVEVEEGRNRCLQGCSNDRGSCPVGFTCTDVPGFVANDVIFSVCRPDSGVCTN